MTDRDVDTDAGLRAARPHARPATADPPGQAAARPHYAARFKDALDRRIARRLRARGWTVRIESYPGYGSPHWVRVLARSVLAAPHVPDDELPGAGAAQAGGHWHGPQALAVRGWRSFLTLPAPGARIQVRIGSQVHHVVTDRGGNLDTVLPADLAPGWHDVELCTQDRDATIAPIQVVDPALRSGVVADVDDTIMVTRLPRPFIAGWNAFVRHEHAREAVPGMADLFARLRAERPDLPVFYLSTGAWNAAPAIGRFLSRHGFPAGTLLLTDWGPTNTGWFRSGPRHKVNQLHRLFTELPDIMWVLVGDDGQHDPVIYAGAAEHFPDHVRAIVIRQLTFAEHVLARGPLAPDVSAGRAGLSGHVLVLQGPDGHALARQADEAGLHLR